MRRLAVFNTVSLDGYFTDAGNDMRWAHAGSGDPEFAAFTAENAKGGGALVFGRMTYDMMAAFWPTPLATQMQPAVAERMSAMEKFVISHMVFEPEWANTTVLTGDPIANVRALKERPGEDLAILGSGSIVAQLTQAKLIDEFQLVIAPVVLGTGRTLFDGMTDRVNLKLLRTRAFQNGKVFAAYALV